MANILLILLIVLGQYSHTEFSAYEELQQQEARTFTLSQIYPGDIMKATSVVLVDGRNGARKTITSQDKVKRIVSVMKDIELTPSNEETIGYIHRVLVYEDSELKLDLSNNSVNHLSFSSNDRLNTILTELFDSASFSPGKN
ncbi:hypothetical protein [Paenibacillus silviterrae]|uniref:hypothetical protein n=1 Tax=Paenibacillus silviterrae TaxID=3242194 RepID=UPI002543D304|nr:hypothetical protein [Paenibacillus chinjuensis]